MEPEKLKAIGCRLVGLVLHMMVASTGCLGFLEVAKEVVRSDGQDWEWIRARNGDTLLPGSLYRFVATLEREPCLPVPFTRS